MRLDPNDAEFFVVPPNKEQLFIVPSKPEIAGALGPLIGGEPLTPALAIQDVDELIEFVMSIVLEQKNAKKRKADAIELLAVLLDASNNLAECLRAEPTS